MWTSSSSMVRLTPWQRFHRLARGVTCLSLLYVSAGFRLLFKESSVARYTTTWIGVTILTDSRILLIESTAACSPCKMTFRLNEFVSKPRCWKIWLSCLEGFVICKPNQGICSTRQRLLFQTRLTESSLLVREELGIHKK
ncbi:hypothetical protein CTAM01_06900 [Colletotrichum tamarilloi]|uniref:Secreted protein n=1 Tax=Colletotrichum tamarilloi TaxID=1209934 RepID=A0ABQ9RAG2_9PEZI|nr:uncharacterized protein CTAM01_06900 [Colletotrichum tamarilloi]KAK1499706.1 hypothetical protein CTAM01_06900 [Colletotrichum tamarilloi]